MGRDSLTDGSGDDLDNVIAAAAKVIESVTDGAEDVTSDDLVDLGISSVSTAGLVAINSATDVSALDTIAELQVFAVM